jgi:hypothetical protein
MNLVTSKAAIKAYVHKMGPSWIIASMTFSITTLSIKDLFVTLSITIFHIE